MKKGWLGTLLFLLSFAWGPAPVFASHIVGGEMTYKCLGIVGSGNTKYEIRLDIYQDCIAGAPTAIIEDDPAFLRVFTGDGSSVFFDSVASFGPPVTVPPNFSNACVNNPPLTCLRKLTFIRQIDLAPNVNGYLVVYQRCCRNASIRNIMNPGNVGATYFCRIPPIGTANPCNNSAVFNNFPPQIICINNPLVYDHAATDPDGDSLSYEFCQSFVGGQPTDAKPIPVAPPYLPVVYSPGFLATKPMIGSPQVQINPVTGQISGTPNLVGRFVVTVCCNEWRNGVLINTVKREFQFVVTNCSKAVVANIPQYSEEFNTYIVECKSNTVVFDNISTGGFEYFWDFGVPGLQSDTSHDFSPTYTYPDTGTYFVRLLVNKGSTCPDSIMRIVKIYPVFFAHYNFDGLQCPNTPIQFEDSSWGSFTSTQFWTWNFGDGNSADIPNPQHSFAQGGTYNVSLTTKNGKGCKDTHAKEIYIENFIPFGANDTIIVKEETIHYHARGGNQYTWTPSIYLSNPNISNPSGYYPDTGRFYYTVHIKSEYGCEGDDTFNVWVVNQASIFVPTGFTPNGDGRNDMLRPFGIGYARVNYFRVFNRWGQQVFYTTKFGEGWNGTWKGAKCDTDTYFWTVSLMNRFGKEEVIKGDSILIR